MTVEGADAVRDEHSLILNSEFLLLHCSSSLCLVYRFNVYCLANDIN
jgi:hypothetical protein